MKIFVINATCGYVESSMNASTWFAARHVHDSIEQAIGALAADLFVGFFNERLDKPQTKFHFNRKCCQENFEKKLKFCSECGYPLGTRKVTKETIEEEFEPFITEICSRIADGTGYVLSNMKLWEMTTAKSIISEMFPQAADNNETRYENIVFIEQSAEKILPYYLKKFTEEDILNKREYLKKIFDSDTVKAIVEYAKDIDENEKWMIEEFKRDNEHILGK